MSNSKRYLILCNDLGVTAFLKQDLRAKKLNHIEFDLGEKPAKIIQILEELFNQLNWNITSLDRQQIRLYASGCFSNLSSQLQDSLIMDVFVEFGLLFNIIAPDLEAFYLSGSTNIMEGILLQEFRSVVICGSFQQFLPEIGQIRDLLTAKGVDVPSPWTTNVIPSTLGTDFILLEGQAPLKNSRDAWRHKLEHMRKFQRVDAIIVCNPGGVVGQGTIFEIGYMIAYAKRIIFTEEPINLLIPFPYEIGLNFD